MADNSTAPEKADTIQAADTPESSNAAGGSGGVYILPGKGLKNARLERQAIMRRWDVPDAALKPLINRQIQIAASPSTDNTESTRAFKAVLSARQQDLEIEKLERGIEDKPGQSVTVNVLQQSLDLSSASVEDLRALRNLRNRLAGVPGERSGDEANAAG